MKECPALIVALPREVSGLVKGWERKQPAHNVNVYTNGHAVVACAGMGAARAALAVQAAMAAMPVTALISAGVAGACDPALRVGEIVRAGVVIDSRTGERFADLRGGQVLVTADVVASVREKARLRDSYGAAAVDMEAAAVARLARAHGLHFQAIKAISDEADFEVDGLGRFATPDGQFREGAFALHAALRPAIWGKVIALGRGSGAAVNALTAALEGELDWYRKRSAMEEKNVV
ncbi:MAG TPA: phosphorylase [Acidobacteriaceae bacterium]